MSRLHVLIQPGVFTGQWMEIDENADVVNVLVTTGQLVPTLGKLLLFKLDGAFKATCKLSFPPVEDTNGLAYNAH